VPFAHGPDQVPDTLGRQHAHPGGLLHFALALMHVFPQGCPLVQCLQQASLPCASSIDNGGGGASRPSHGE